MHQKFDITTSAPRQRNCMFHIVGLGQNKNLNSFQTLSHFPQWRRLLKLIIWTEWYYSNFLLTFPPRVWNQLTKHQAKRNQRNRNIVVLGPNNNVNSFQTLSRTCSTMSTMSTLHSDKEPTLRSSHVAFLPLLNLFQH